MWCGRENSSAVQACPVGQPRELMMPHREARMPRRDRLILVGKDVAPRGGVKYGTLERGHPARPGEAEKLLLLLLGATWDVATPARPGEAEKVTPTATRRHVALPYLTL